jgi:hypothetical protein
MLCRFLFFAALALTPLTAAALMPHKTGGGCIVREDLCELDEYKSIESISVAPQIDRLQEELDWAPALAEILTETSKTRDWYLETRPFNPALCAPIAPVEVDPKIQIAACQNVTEVRISKTFWRRASSEQKFRLIVHELVTSYVLDHETSPELAREAIVQIFRTARPELKRDRLMQLGFPRMMTSNEIGTFMDFVGENRPLICALDEPALVDAWRMFVRRNFAVIFGYRRDFQIAAQDEINALLKAIASSRQSGTCALVEGLAREEFATR